jgi:hypothetical protein
MSESDDGDYLSGAPYYMYAPGPYPQLLIFFVAYGWAQ